MSETAEAQPPPVEPPRYPTGAEIRGLLPTEDPLISDDQCQFFVNQWIGLIREAGGTRPSHTSVRIVTQGAWADAMTKFVADSGYMADMDAVDKARSWADKALLKFDGQVQGPSESAPAASVRNVSPAPLWGDPWAEL